MTDNSQDELQQARDLAAKREWGPVRVLADIEHIDPHNGSLLRKWRSIREELIPGLLSILQTRSGLAKFKASWLLLHLGEKRGTQGLIDLLQGSDERLVLLTLNWLKLVRIGKPAATFQDLTQPSEILVDHAALWAALKPWLQRPTTYTTYTGLMALDVIMRLDVPESKQALKELKNHPRAEVCEKINDWLRSETKDQEGAGNVLSQDWANEEPTQAEEQNWLDARQFVEHNLITNDVIVVNEVYQAMEKLVGSPDELTVLEKILESKLDSWVRGAALERRAALEGKSIWPRLQKILDDGTEQFLLKSAVRSLILLLSKDSSEDLRNSMRTTLGNAIDRSNNQTRRAILDVLLAIRGPIEASLDKIEERCDPWDRTRIRWFKNHWGPEEVAKMLVAADVIQPLSQEFQVKLKAAFQEKRPTNPFAVICGLLGGGNQLTEFDTECADVPPRYADLLEDLASISQGIFAIEAPSQDPEAGTFEFGQQGVIVRFIYEDRLFQFHAREQGDWYDVGAVLSAVNGALEAFGKAERFFVLFTGDQICMIAFAKAANFLEVANRLQIPIQRDFDAA